MRLADLIAGLATPLALDDDAAGVEAGAVEIGAITADSRAVTPGAIFAALPGARVDGRAFIAEALARGAVAVLVPRDMTWPEGVAPVPLLRAATPRRALALIAARLAGGAQPETVAAVTGTNGKTSVVSFLREIWARAGFAAASLGTLGLVAAGFPPGPSLTTPDPVALAATLKALAAAGISHLAMEASSHGLDQYRLDGVRLAAGAFTNLTRDHLDYHGAMAAYRAAKLRLFADLLPTGAPAVYASGLERETREALAAIAARRRLRLLSVGEGGDVIALERVTPLPDGQEIAIRAEGARHTLRLALAGRFQAENALLAAALALALGADDALAALPHLAGVRGRMERVAALANGAAIYVDYAHTPDALARVLEALRPHAGGRLVVVFGAGGDRDRGKRPLMGEVAGRLADRVIITDDNPRGENPALIRAAIRAACPNAAEIGDRRSAIAAAIEGLGAGDLLVVAGKGHEQGQIVGTETIPFDDAAVVRDLVGGAA